MRGLLALLTLAATSGLASSWSSINEPLTFDPDLDGLSDEDLQEEVRRLIQAFQTPRAPPKKVDLSHFYAYHDALASITPHQVHLRKDLKFSERRRLSYISLLVSLGFASADHSAGQDNLFTDMQIKHVRHHFPA